MDRLADRFQGMHRELLDLLDYVKRTRSALGSVREELPRASTALSSIEEVTERAAHNLLNLVERALEADELTAEHIEALTEGVGGKEGLETAVREVSSAHRERSGLFAEMMTELSFQDLTCQTIEKVSQSLSGIEERILHILDPDAHPVASPAPAVHAGSMSGLSRLEEIQSGHSRQDMVDELLGALDG